MRRPDAPQRRAAPGALLVAAALALGCAEGAEAPAASGISTGAAAALLERHRAAFERFEAWAERSAASDATFDDARALDEVAFSPVRRDPTVVAAIIERSGGGALLLVHPAGAVLPEDARYVRVAGGGGIEVGDVEVSLGDEARAATVLRRERAGARGASLRVTVAFAREP